MTPVSPAFFIVEKERGGGGGAGEGEEPSLSLRWKGRESNEKKALELDYVH